jgi:hypothetical protein
MKAKLCLIGGCKTEGLLLLDNGCVFYGEFEDADEELSTANMVYSKPVDGILTFPNKTFFDGLVTIDEDSNVEPLEGEVFNHLGEFLHAIGEGVNDEVALTSELPNEDEVLH